MGCIRLTQYGTVFHRISLFEVICMSSQHAGVHELGGPVGDGLDYQVCKCVLFISFQLQQHVTTLKRGTYHPSV